MAQIQDILSQLQQMGIGGTSYGGIAGITPEQIAGGLQSTYGLTAEDLPSSMFQGITQGALGAGLGKTYAPQIQAGSSSLISKLQESLGGKVGRKAMGGFAGSGQGQTFTQGAKDVYGKGMSDVLGQAGQQRMTGLSNIQDMINQWRQSALRVKGLAE